MAMIYVALILTTNLFRKLGNILAAVRGALNVDYAFVKL
jgi:hypothetical protein